MFDVGGADKASAKRMPCDSASASTSSAARCEIAGVTAGVDHHDPQQKQTIPTPTEPRSMFKTGIRHEVAQDVLGALIAHAAYELARAREATNPDSARIAAIEAEQRQWCDRRETLDHRDASCCRPVPHSREGRAWFGTAALHFAPFGCAATPLCLAPLRACSAAS